MNKTIVLTEAEISKLKGLLDSDPETFKQLTGKSLAGRKKGVKNKKPEVGDVIETVEEIDNDAPIPISEKEAKKLQKKPRKPMSEETKEKLKAALEKAREANKAKREAEKDTKQKEKEEKERLKKIEEAAKKKEELAKQGKVIKKYIVVEKPEKKKRERVKKFVKRVVESDDEEDTNLETDFEPTTESEMSEATIMKKIDKRRNIINKIDSIKSELSSQPRFNPFRR